MQRVLTEFNEVKNLIYAHTGITLDEYSAFYQYIVEFSEYTSIIFQVVDLTSTETQTTKRMIFCFRRRNYSDINNGPFTTDYFNPLFKYHDEDYGGYYLATSKKINEDPDGNTWEGYVDYWIVDSNNGIITDPYTEAGYFSEYVDINETITVYENYDSAIGDYSDFTFTVVDSFTNLYNSTRQSVPITTMTELNALFRAKAGIDIPTTNAEYTDYSMYDKVQEYLNFGAGVHIVVYRAVESDQTVPQKVWVIRPYYSTHDVSYDDLYIRPDSDTEAMLTSRTELIYTRFDFWNLGTEYEVYDEDSSLYESSYTYMGFYPDLYSSSPSSCIEIIYGLKEPPTMDEAVQQYRDLCEDIAAAIKETIGLRPNTTKLDDWLYRTPRAYGWSNYSGYTYRDDAKEDIVNECIKSLASYEDQVYYCSISIEYYETASRGTSGCTSYIDIYKYTSQSRYAESVKTYLCRFRLNINTSGTSYPKYIGIAEKITENIQDISHYGVDYSDTLYDKRYPNQNLLIPKTTIKPYEFAKTILGSGPESNHYNYRWILRDTANAIKSVSGSSDDINAQDLPDAIRALSNEQGGNTE